MDCNKIQDCVHCPDFCGCYAEFQENLQRRMNNTIFGGDTTFEPEDFLELGDLLRPAGVS